MVSDAEKQRLIGLATRLFAELGHDGTSMRLIADAAGVDVETLVAVFGQKSDLYRTIMLRVYEEERDALAAGLAEFTPTRRALTDLADVYLDHYVAHPYTLWLWMHRWLGDAVDVPGLEELYSRPLATMVADAVRDLVPPDVDPDNLIWTIVWSVYGFLSGGLQYTGAHPPGRSIPHSSRGQVLDPAALIRFRAHLHTLILRMTLPLPEDEVRAAP